MADVDEQAEYEVAGDTNDHGLTKDEQAIFDQMRSEDSGAVEDQGGGEADTTGTDQQHVAGDQDAGDDDDAGDDTGAERSGEPGQDGQQQDGQKRRPRRVAWNTHEREVKAREDKIKELEGKLNGTAEERAKLAERLDIINEAFKSRQQPEAKAQDDDPEPDAEADIFEHNKWLGRQLSKATEQINELRESGRSREADQMLQQSYTADMHRFVATEPNFVAAYNHLMGSRVAELADYFFGKDVMSGVALTPEESKRIETEIVKEEKALVKRALDAGQSPSATMFRMARVRGFVPPAAQQADAAAGKEAAGKQDGKQPGKAPGSLDTDAAVTGKTNGNGVNVRAEIEASKRAVADSASLSAGGGAPTISLTPERLANMPEKEFHDLMEQLSPDQLALIMGGVAQH